MKPSNSVTKCILMCQVSVKKEMAHRKQFCILKHEDHFLKWD